MEIIHFSAELAPVGKVGGLGDVLHGLSRSLISLGHSVEIVMPKYDMLDWSGIEKLQLIETAGAVTIWKGIVATIPVTFIESHDPDELFDRGKIYGCHDDPLRFTFFCMQALHYLKYSQRQPDVIHLHDWHTAVAAPLLKERFPEMKAKCVFTIHNLSYQGHCEKEVLDKLGWKSEKIKENGCYNLMKAGIIYADHVTTVSPNYAHEILTTDHGGTLRPLLRKCKNKFSGILNGIDYDYWNPMEDPLLPAKFSLEKFSGKKKVKQELRKRLSLEEEMCPLVTAVTRLVPQKGPDLIKAALLRTLEWGGQFVLLGSALDETTHAHFYNLKRKLAGTHHVHLELTFNEELSHLVYGGSDLFLVPSLFEPCGLTQMIAMRYGSVPLVRETGGLVDTVFEGKNGFLFSAPTAEAICQAIDRALPLWDTPKWTQLVETGMKSDLSWKKPAEEYLKIYKSSGS